METRMTLRVDETLLEQTRRKAFDLGAKNDTAAIRLALAQFVSEQAATIPVRATPQYRPDNAEAHQHLETLMNTGKAGVVLAALKAAYGEVEPAARRANGK